MDLSDFSIKIDIKPTESFIISNYMGELQLANGF